MTSTGTAGELLAELCHDLHLMWQQAGGPGLRALGSRLRLSKSQVGTILNGGIRRPPAWDTVRGLVECFVGHADDRGVSLSVPTGVTEFWRPRHMMLEYAFSHPRPTPGSWPRQLPPPVRRLVGRAEELRELDVLAARWRGAAATIVVSGPAGAGKTALAVRWAQQARERFPHGQLFAELRTGDPASTLRGFLLASGIRAVPAGLDARSARYRSEFADRRVLVVLDDARDTDQVLPLLPGSPGSLVLVTSRHPLPRLVAAVDAHPLVLGPLAPEAARQLLTARLGPAAVSAEPGVVTEIIARAGGLPGPLATVAATAATNPGTPLAAL